MHGVEIMPDKMLAAYLVQLCLETKGIPDEIIQAAKELENRLNGGKNA